MKGPRFVGEGAWEVRVGSLASGRSRLADAGFEQEACTAPLKAGEPQCSTAAPSTLEQISEPTLSPDKFGLAPPFESG